ncbi:MAG: murein biosynthesis integral membrane protein MurJ [Candidatus Kerfeldbacteria bacterium RIFCSPHIGHO2_12_FULL_48_17]|uniref:Murein biosynthesis integral membrane protein MurJ n=1 Tax=Candidatus Kerfeldbacteria bacterium RIFCSPHIGHO2_12_FULL_48_17 TaxID=1798542 RepID=A0A1G2B8A1_9BACT|nr:MAG: murein biosynthesis integral membrane protein MurJ [Candidatus Kerfeldbacteria bacterium RIFCSPHIGHO2_12_FULL_48_17]
MHTFLANAQQKFTRGAAILSVTSFASYFLGLVRDRLFAHTFGASAELDTYNAAFIVPDLLLNILVAGALQAAFLPLFNAILKNKGKTSAQEFASSVLNIALLVVFVAALLAVIFMPLLAPLIAPGFSPEQRATLINLSRILLLSPLIFAASNTLGTLLISAKNYTAYGLSPVFYNFGIIAGTFWLVPHFGIYGVALGTLAGALLHLAIRIIGFHGLALRLKPLIHVRIPEMKRLLVLMLPKMVGHPVEQLSFWAFTSIASGLAAGSITIISFARNFMSVPVSLFGIAFATAVFPLLSDAALTGKSADFLSQLRNSLKKILLFTVPSAAFLVIFGYYVVKILLGSGAFDDNDVRLTAGVLSIFALSIPLESISHLLARAFYALQNTLLPVIFSLASLVVAIGAAALLAPRFGITMVAWAFLLGSLTKLLLLAIFLPRTMAAQRS